MRRVFLDTVGLIALWDVSDQWHSFAAAAFADLQETPFIAYTSLFVLLECANSASRRPYRPLLTQLRRDMENDGLLMIPSPQQIEIAWKSYDNSAPGGPGIVDLVSFQVMRQFQCTDAFSNDAHFRAAGFVTLF